MRTLTVLVAVMGAIVASAGPAAARSGDGLTFGEAILVGDDCTRGGPPAPVYDIPNKRFGVTFSGFEAVAEGDGDVATASCEVRVPVFLDRGFRLKVTDTLFVGDTTLGKTDAAHLLGEVRFHGLPQAPVYRVDKRFLEHAGEQKTFAEKGYVQGDYNTCGETKVVVSISTRVEVENHGSKFATVAVDSVEHTLGGGVGLGVAAERC